jgi:photosystem II stability/assembly factor-like uncharacterized protein/tetratricopeptide (TPR) repeat protein
MLADAQLTDVFFASHTHGWAVGDRGLILHTVDGGRHWAPQNSTVDGRLASVFFLDEQNGWAAGGAMNPFTPATTGILLRTRDGGHTWSHDRRLALPAIARIKFSDASHGWALGQASAYFPSGVYTTNDGGRSWAALPAAAGGAWLTGDFVDPNTGALAGRTSALAVVKRRGVEPVAADFGIRALHQMRLAPPASGWLVGDGGLVLTSRDLGKNWQTTETDIPSALREQFDFTALAVQGPHCWIAGTPGTRVLHSGDGGRSWEVADTGQPLPIRALYFLDPSHGFAVGDLGTILATSDGGRTWNRQRGEHRRAAYSGIFARASEIPLELLARFSADEGYLGTMELLSREDLEIRPTQIDPLRQAHEAAALVGGSLTQAAWRFPLRDGGLRLSAEQIVAGWNLANDGKAVDHLEAYVVSRIRMWRPSVVFTASADVRGIDPLAHLVNQVVLRAVERAGDPNQYPQQIADAGLQTWKVQKVYASLSGDQSGTTNINTAQLSAQTGRTIAELAASARGVLAGNSAPSPATVGFRLLVNQVPQQLGERDIFSGVPLSPGGEARRSVNESAENNLDAAKREAQLRRNLQAILAQAENGQQDGRFLADFGEQTRQLEPDRAAEVMVQLGERYQRQGRWELAAECFELVVERYPKSTLATRSLVWLVQYYASTEAAWRMRAGQQHTIQQVTALQPARRPAAGPVTAPRDGARQAGGAGARPEVGARADVERGGGTVVGSSEIQTRLEKACGYARQIEQLHPGLYGEPVVRFPLAVAHRQQGLPGQAQRFYMALRHTRPVDAWRACAMGELWLTDTKTEPPKPLSTCLRAKGKPYLDGQLEEPFWQSGKPVELHSPVGDDEAWGAVAMLAYDEEFLYLAVRCTHAPGRKYVPSSDARPRDADLADQDRMELMLDVDRDFATYYRLTVDSRGWTAESCWHDKSWNPNWFVAHALEEDAWAVEAAIPLAELTNQLPQANTVWAVGLQRIVPGVGIQSWTQPATTEGTPEGFGYLYFEGVEGPK